MSVRILTDGENAALYCSTSEWAFGPVFSEDGKRDAQQVAERFLRWLPSDAREYLDNALTDAYIRFLDWNERHYTFEDWSELGLAAPDCLISEAMDLMSEDCIHKDDFPDRESDYIIRILDKGPWMIQAKEKVA